MAKRSREAEDLEPGGDATGSGVPAYADFYHSNDSHRPSGKWSGLSLCLSAHKQLLYACHSGDQGSAGVLLC